MSNQVLVVCDYDPLYAAIELKLTGLPQVRVMRLDLTGADRPKSAPPADGFELIIVAPMPPINDPMSILSKASLLNQVGHVPVLIISEHPSRPESDDKIAYLNFPFDIDELPLAVSRTLGASRSRDTEHAV